VLNVRKGLKLLIFMKNKMFFSHLLLLAILSALILGCKKEQQPESDTLPEVVWDGTGQALRNNQTLDLKCSARMNTKYPGKMGMVLQHFNEQDYLRGSLLFGNIPYKKGEYVPIDNPLSQDPATDSLFTVIYSTIILDGDVFGDKYELIDTSSNFFSVDSLNLDTKEVFGRFSLLMRKDTSFMGEMDKSVPHILEFSKGSYAVTVTR
jgi:hypothetical protein